MEATLNSTITNAFAKSWDILGRYSKPVCSISGGADSDIMLDIVHKLDDEHKVLYIWFNTGLEFDATKRHLDFLRDKYSVDIIPLKPILPVAATVRKHGYPFVSKLVSARIAQLQRHNFHFRAGTSYEDDIRQFNNCKNSIDWWHNKRSFHTLNISRIKLLKEFLCAHPPHFNISDRCCDLSKKNVAKKFIREHYSDLNIIGTRKLEGGIRQAHTTCFHHSKNGVDTFEPIFWFSNSDKDAYCETFGVTHSDCYTVYGLQRTGCVGCPFNPRAEKELSQLLPYEEGIVNAAKNIFAPSYEYTRLFKQFRAFFDHRQLSFINP